MEYLRTGLVREDIDISDHRGVTVCMVEESDKLTLQWTGSDAGDHRVELESAIEGSTGVIPTRAWGTT